MVGNFSRSSADRKQRANTGGGGNLKSTELPQAEAREVHEIC
jgi:hypothetical protein